MKISSTWNQDQGDQEKFKLNEFSKNCFDVIEHAEYTMKLVINKVALGKSSSIDIPQYFLQSDPLAGKSWFTFSTIKKLYYPLSIVRMDEAHNSYGGISNRNITDDGGSTANVERVPHMKVCLMIRSECNNEENEPEDFMTQTTVLGGIYWFTAIRSVHVSGRVLIRFSCPDAPHVRPLIFRVPIILQSSPISLSTECVLQENAARSVSSSKKRRKRQIQSSNSKAPTSPNSVKERRNLNSNHQEEEEEVSQYAIQEIPSHSDISSGMNWKQNDDHTSGRRVDMRADNCTSHQSLKFDWENHFDHTVCGHYINETYATCRYRKYTCTRCGTKLYNKNHALQHIADRKPPCLTMTSVKVVSCPDPIQAVKELIRDYWAQEDVDVGEVTLDGCHPDETSTDSNRNSIHQCSNVPIVDVSSSVEGGGVPQGISDAVPHTVTTAHLENSSMDLNFDALRSSTVGHGHESLESTGREPCQGTPGPWQQKSQPCNDDNQSPQREPCQGTPGPWQQNSQPCNDDNQSPQSITSTATEMQLLLGPLELEVPSKETMSDGLYHPSSAVNDSYTVRTVTETTHTTPMIDNLLSAAAYTMKLVIHADSGNGIVGGNCIPNTFQQSRPLPGCGSSWFTLAVTPQEGLYYPLSIARIDEADNRNSNGNSNATKVCLTIRSECSDALDQPEDFTTQTTAMGGIFWFIAVRSVHVSGRVLIHFSCPDAPHVRPLSFRVPIISLPQKPLQSLTQSCFKNTSQHAVRSPGQQHSDAASAGNHLISPTIWQIRSPASFNKDELAERSVSFEPHRRGCASEKDNDNAGGNIRGRSLFPCCRDSCSPHTITPIESETQSETVTAAIYVDFEKRALHQIES